MAYRISGWIGKNQPTTCRELPDEDCLLFIGSFVGEHGKVGARASLERMVAKANAMGFNANAALEFDSLYSTKHLTPYVKRATRT